MLGTPEEAGVVADAAAAGEPRLEDFAGLLPGFELLELLGWGGMGAVFRARQLSTGRVVALKVIHRGACANAEWARQRLFSEAQAAARLDHPHIVPLYEFGDAAGMPYFTMRLVEGGTLASRRAELALSSATGDPARERVLAAWCAKVVDALQHMHERGVLHRDLKPSNILLDAAGEPFVTDFGLAVAAESELLRLTVSGQVLGTPAYMAPEVAEGGAKAATVRSDVYSLGVILYELICGRLPFEGATPLAILSAVTTRDAPAPSSLNHRVSRDLATIASRCIERDLPKRYASAADVAADLRRFIAGEPILARELGAWERGEKWLRRRPALAAAAGLALLATLVGGGVSFWQWHLAESGRP